MYTKVSSSPWFSKELLIMKEKRNKLVAIGWMMLPRKVIKEFLD